MKILYFLTFMAFWFTSQQSYAQSWEIAASIGFKRQYESATFINGQNLKEDEYGYKRYKINYQTQNSSRLNFKRKLKFIDDKWYIGGTIGHQNSHYKADFFRYSFPEQDINVYGLRQEKFYIDDFEIVHEKYLFGLFIEREMTSFLSIYTGGGSALNKHRFVDGFLTSSFHLFERDVPEMKLNNTSNLFLYTGVNLNVPIYKGLQANLLLEFARQFEDVVIKDLFRVKHLNFVYEAGISYKF